MTSFYVPSAIKSACDKSHNWITTRASKFRTLSKGYSKIRPKMLPKGLTEFKKEHCEKFDEETNDVFLRCNLRSNSVEEDSMMDYNESDKNIFPDKFSAKDVQGFNFNQLLLDILTHKQFH